MATLDALIEETSRDSIDALDCFLTLGLKHYAANLASGLREYEVSKAQLILMTQNLPAGEEFTFGFEASTRLVKWWEHVAFVPPQKCEGSASSIVWKECKDLNVFIYWARLCQTHREMVAGKRTAASAAKQGSAASAAEEGRPGYLPSWRGGSQLSEHENTDCFELTMNHILQTQLTPDQRRKSCFHWDPRGRVGP